jgi:hypothetical protein
MPHVFETASTGRSKCRGCDQPIAKGDVRFGERVPNPFAEGETTLWFHPLCAAYKRPESMLETLDQAPEMVTNRDVLERAARSNARFRRLPRISGAERSPSGRAKCRQCREPIEKGSWRIRLVFYEEGRFSPAGDIHLGCRGAYFETEEGILEPVLHFSAELSDEDRQELVRAFDSTGDAGA